MEKQFRGHFKRETVLLSLSSRLLFDADIWADSSLILLIRVFPDLRWDLQPASEDGYYFYSQLINQVPSHIPHTTLAVYLIYKCLDNGKSIYGPPFSNYLMLVHVADFTYA